MTLGNKLSQLRKEHNYTQEQLAQILGVSRQAVSKWESDPTYPETEKLLKLGDLYGCSMDYLLKDGQRESAASSASHTITLSLNLPYFERMSSKTIHGLPLWHINIGYGRTAKGIIAIGLSARGIVSVGLISLGVLSMGVFSLGLLSLGVIALGIASAGAIAVGLAALGAISVGILSVGALSMGPFSVGAMAMGTYFAMGDHAEAMIALGRTEAAGSVFQKLGTVTAQETAFIKEWLDSNVPFYLSWAKEIIKLLL